MQQVIAVGRPDPHGGKARRERRVCAFPPGDRLPSLNRQAFGEIERRERLVIAIAPHPRGRTASPAPGLGRQRRLAGGPECGRGLDADHVEQTQSGQCCPEGGVHAIAGVGQHYAS